MEWKLEIQDIIKKYKKVFIEMSEYIYYHPELKFEEFKSSEYYIEKSKEFGFDVNSDIPNLPTAFISTYGSGTKHIGFLGEFDALPDLYQTPNVAYKDDEGKKIGHGCGHNLLGMGSFISAVIVKELIDKHNLDLKVSFFGCPGEEIGSGKTFMVRDGVFNGVDLALTWHPSPSNSIMTQSSLANVLVDFHFKGLSSHAANSPHLGRSALDAVELMNVGANYLREHVPTTNRIHYAITDSGGMSPSVVQDHATVKYLIRAENAKEVLNTYERVINIAKGASLMTETEVEIDFIKGCSNYIGNKALENVLYDALNEMYDVHISEDMKKFAKEIYNSFTENQKTNKLTSMVGMGFMDDESYLDDKYIYDRVSPYHPSTEIFAGSTDVSDVSWNVPTAQLSCATSAIGTPLHTWQMTAQGISDLAHSGMFTAGKSMALAALNATLDENNYKKIQFEFDDFKNNNEYICPISKDIKPR